ncbi:stage III sporulation protein AG [Clostridium sp.]
MWKLGWNLDKEWVKRNEKWLILLVLGLAILILYAPFGKKTNETGVWQSGERWAESGIGMNSGNIQIRSTEASGSEESDSDIETGLTTSTSKQDSSRLYELRLEQRIRDVLKNVDGVGEVDVMLTLFSSSEKVLRVDKERSRATTSETDSSGGTRQQADESLRESTVLAGSSGSGEPVVEKELAPEISGIVISAQGGGNASVQKEISEAMQALFGLPAHKIKVLKRVE